MVLLNSLYTVLEHIVMLDYEINIIEINQEMITLVQSMSWSKQKEGIQTNRFDAYVYSVNALNKFHQKFH